MSPRLYNTLELVAVTPQPGWVVGMIEHTRRGLAAIFVASLLETHFRTRVDPRLDTGFRCPTDSSPSDLSLRS